MVREKGVPTGYKKTEVGVIPEDWEVISMNDSSTLKARIGWQGLTTKEYLFDGEYYLVTGTDFVNGEIAWNTCNFVDGNRYHQDKNIQIKVGDVLVTKDGTIGKVAFVDYLPKEATLNSGVFVIRPKENCYNSLYFNYVMNSKIFERFLNKLAAGSTISHLYQKDFIEFCFPLPPLPEQKAIAKVLSDVDQLIASIEKLIDKKRNIKQGTMQLLLTGKKRLPGFTGEWEVKRLEDCTVTNPEYGINAPAVEYNESLPTYLRITDISRDGKLLDSDKRSVVCKNIPRYLLSEGDLVFARTGASVGKTYLYDSCDGRLVFAGYLIRVKTNKEKLVPRFLKSYTETTKYWNWVKTMSMRSGQPGISGKEYSQLPIPLPPLPEQKAIAQILSDMDLEIEALEKKLHKYKLIKEGMMEKLLTGKVRLV